MYRGRGDRKKLLLPVLTNAMKVNIPRGTIIRTKPVTNTLLFSLVVKGMSIRNQARKKSVSRKTTNAWMDDEMLLELIAAT